MCAALPFVFVLDGLLNPNAVIRIIHFISLTYVFVLLFSPISVAGFLGVLKDPAWFIAEQIQQPIPVAVSENSVVVAHQLGNMYLLGFFIAMSVFLTTSETKVIRAYLVALLLGDIGHIAFTCLALGKDRMLRPHEWNTMTCANIGFVVSFSIVLLLSLLSRFQTVISGAAL